MNTSDPDNVIGKWPYLFRGLRNVNIAEKYPTGNEGTWQMSRATVAQTIADTLADRLAIASDGAINVTLSAQQLLACADWGGTGKYGDYNSSPPDLTKLLEYTIWVGLVPERCYPFDLAAYINATNSNSTTCLLPSQYDAKRNPLYKTKNASPRSLATPGMCPVATPVCNATGSGRVDCGETDPQRCEQVKGCCFDYAHTFSDPNTTRCFKAFQPNPAPPPSACVAKPDNRIDCGSVSDPPQVCRAKGCCYDDSVPPARWCFQPAVPPAPYLTKKNLLQFYKSSDFVEWRGGDSDEGDAYLDLKEYGPIISTLHNIFNEGIGLNGSVMRSTNYCDGYLCSQSGDRSYCVIQEGCGPAPLANIANISMSVGSYYNRIVGYSSGCEKVGLNDCKPNAEGQFYVIEQSNFGVSWGARGYSRQWGTELLDNFMPDSCREGDKPCSLWGLHVNTSAMDKALHTGPPDPALVARRRQQRQQRHRMQSNPKQVAPPPSPSPWPSPLLSPPLPSFFDVESDTDDPVGMLVPSVANNTCPGHGATVCTGDVNRPSVKIKQCCTGMGIMASGQTFQDLEVCPDPDGEGFGDIHDPLCCPGFPGVDSNGVHRIGHSWTCPNALNWGCCSVPQRGEKGIVGAPCMVLCEGNSKPPGCLVKGEECPNPVSTFEGFPVVPQPNE